MPSCHAAFCKISPVGSLLSFPQAKSNSLTRGLVEWNGPFRLYCSSPSSIWSRATRNKQCPQAAEAVAMEARLMKRACERHRLIQMQSSCMLHKICQSQVSARGLLEALFLSGFLWFRHAAHDGSQSKTQSSASGSCSK